MKKINTLALVTVVSIVALTLGSCVQKQTTSDSSELLRSSDSLIEDLSAEAGTSDALCKYLSAGGYYRGNTLPAGTKVAMSMSYKTDSQDSNSAEAGQKEGEVTADGFLMQGNFSTGQLALCPGAIGGMGRNKCLWKINGDDGYLELARRVACNTAATYGSRGALHPGYQKMQASKVSFRASTAGRSFQHDDTVKVALSGGSSSTLLYFAKGQGLVGMEFRETAMPSGTAKLYFGAGGSSAGLAE